MSFFTRLKRAIKTLFNPDSDQSSLKDKFEPLVKRVEENEQIKYSEKVFDEQPVLKTKQPDEKKINIEKIKAAMTPEELDRFDFLNSYGLSVYARAQATKQPYGGYVRPRDMGNTFLGQNPSDGIDGLNPDEDVRSNLIGLAVDYLTRFMIGEKATEAFKVSLLGASIIHEDQKASQLISRIKGLDKESVISAVKLSGYDVVYRYSVFGYRQIDTIKPNDSTVENIITMVNRSLKFFERYGPCVLSGFDLEGGYTEIVANGDGDYLTSDTLWDFKVSKNRYTSVQTLQLLIYWRMGLHSIHPEFKSVEYLGFYNPRTNYASRIWVERIPPDIIEKVEFEVIGYRPKGKEIYFEEGLLEKIQKRIGDIYIP